MATGMRMLLTSCLLCVSQIAMAGPLPDPTRPAIDMNSSGTGGGVMRRNAVPRGLQSVIISPHYRAAIINGKTVRLGGEYGNSRLVEVRENSVVLQNTRGRRVLELFPKVNIKKIEAFQYESNAPERTSGQTSLPEQDVGEIK
jgi:MSHA biogenesis protein MshK